MADPGVHSYLGATFPTTPTGGVVAAMRRWARQTPHAPFLTAVAEDGHTSEVTYAELDDHSARAASWLSRVDVVRGDPVALIPLNSAVSVAAIFGALRAECPILLLSPTDPVERLREQVGALGIRLVLRDPQIEPEHYPASIELPEPGGLPVSDEPSTRSVDRTADALYFGTSGSTASSKLVAQSHQNILANAEAVRRHHGLGPGDRVLGCLPIHHVNGMHLTILGVVAAGAHVILADRFHPFRYPKLLRDYRPRIASVVPSVLEALSEMWRDPVLPSTFEYFASAAAPLPPGTARTVLDRLGVRVLQGYGLTETTNFSTTVPRDITSDDYRRLLMDVEIPAVGVAVHGNEVAVLRADGTEADPLETGEICMREHNVMSRYVHNPQATEEAFRHGWFHSGDLGHATTDRETGRTYLVITGRSKNIAKVAGETVSLDEMERALRAIPGVRDAVCATVPSRFIGEEIVVGVVFSAEASTRPDVREHLRRSFSVAALPRRVVELEAEPRTATGKIIRPRVADLFAER